MSQIAIPTTTYTLRQAGPDDATAIVRVAQLDSAPVPRGALIVGLADGRLVAAMSVDTGAVVADPFVRTGEVVTMLRARAEGALRHEAAPDHAFGPSMRRLARSGWLRAA